MTKATLAAACIVAAACAANATPPAPKGYTVVASYPHDTTAYTQGLILRPGRMLLESTGVYGQSTLRRVRLDTGAAEKTVPLSADRFGEGLALFDGKLYQLTWQSSIVYRYEEASFALVDSLPFRGEGWGLTTDGVHLIASDGSDSLQVLDPKNLAVIRKIGVKFSSGTPVTKLNELEYIGGEVFANIYQSDWIVRIDPATGQVKEILDLAALLPSHNAAATSENVLNGIAFDPDTGHLLVTGKRWPKLFELRLDHPPAQPRS